MRLPRWRKCDLHSPKENMLELFRGAWRNGSFLAFPALTARPPSLFTEYILASPHTRFPHLAVAIRSTPKA